ncbi:TPA: IS1 family transposase [Yersinia enterocolitica]|nr:IS1 family transposase [Yersinia enterocolitica]
MAKIDVVCPRGSEAQGVIRNGHSSSRTQLYRYNGAKPEPHQTIIDMAMNGSGCRDTARLLKISLNTVLRHLKNLPPASGSAKREPGAEVVICCETDEQWSYVRCKGNLRWLFYADDRIRKRVIAHVFGPRNALTLQRLLVLLGQFTIAFYMTDTWPVYRTLLSSTSHVISKKYTQRIERHNLNLRTHLKRLTRKTICFSKSEEMHDKIIGWYLTINHYH